MSYHKKTNCKTKYIIIASYIGEVNQNSCQRIKGYEAKDNGNHILYEGDRKRFANRIPEKCSSSAHEVLHSGFLQKHHR